MNLFLTKVKLAFQDWTPPEDGSMLGFTITF
jgi:hypothetical protein